MEKNKEYKDAYSRYVCDDDEIRKALNGSFSIVNGFKDKPEEKIDVPKFVKKSMY